MQRSDMTGRAPRATAVAPVLLGIGALLAAGSFGLAAPPAGPVDGGTHAIDGCLTDALAGAGSDPARVGFSHRDLAGDAFRGPGRFVQRLRANLGAIGGATAGPTVVAIGSEASPEFATAVRSAIGEAEQLLSRAGVELPARIAVETRRLPGAADALAFEVAPDGGAIVVSDALGVEDAGRAVVHQAIHLAFGRVEPGFDRDWTEGFARWASGADALALAEWSRARDALRKGWFEGDRAARVGLASLWFAFVDAAFDRDVLPFLFDGLSSGAAPDADALDRAIDRGTGGSLEEAFREFQLWLFLTGPRDDGFHLPFASGMSAPATAARSEWLPVISVQGDPAIARWGADAVAVTPDADDRGGLVLRFEGEATGSWKVDALLALEDGALHRVPIALDDRGQGESVVPVHGVREAVLLIRRLGEGDPAELRYTWSAHLQPGFPFEMADVDLRMSPGGVEIAWETDTEQQLLGFDILRTPADGGVTTKVNPVWVPAIGDPSTGAGYRFLDPTATPGATYLYRVVGLTVDGLTASTEPVRFTVPRAR